METIQNDSPRQPVWKVPVLNGANRVTGTAEITDGSITGYTPLRCICGAKPDPAGDLPCGH